MHYKLVIEAEFYSRKNRKGLNQPNDRYYSRFACLAFDIDTNNK